MNYVVIKTVRKRPEPSLYSLSIVNALQGLEFSSNTTLTETEEIEGIKYTITWVLLPDGYWIPIEFKDNIFVVEDIYTPPLTNEGQYKIPSSGLYVKCLHDYETKNWDGKPRCGVQGKPMPETVPMLNQANFIPLNKEWQEFWFGLLVKSANGTMTDSELITAWVSLTANKRAFTDRHAVENGFCDFIIGKNMGAKPISIKTLSCGGNILNLTRPRGGNRVYFKTLDIRNSPPKIDDVWGDQSVIHFATECTSQKLPDKTFVVGRFPQLKKDGIKRGVPFPIISMEGTNSTWSDRVKKMENNTLYTPYNPLSA